MNRFVLIAIVLLISFPLSAQVVIPSLDPALPNEMASAIAWRFGSTVGVDLNYIKHETQSGDSENVLYQSGGLIAYQPANFIGELFYAPIFKTLDVSSDEFVDGSYASLKLAIRGNRMVSVGLGYESSQTDFNAGKESVVAYEGSFSLRLLDGLFFVGGGMQRVTETNTDSDSRKWNKVMAGVAMQLGTPGKTMFKTEVFTRLLPKAEFDGDSGGTREKTNEVQAIMELQAGAFMFSYGYMQKIMEEYQGSDENYTTTEARYGLGLKTESFSVGLYRYAGRTKWDGSLIQIDSPYERYRVTVGFSFM